MRGHRPLTQNIAQPVELAFPELPAPAIQSSAFRSAARRSRRCAPGPSFARPPTGPAVDQHLEVLYDRGEGHVERRASSLTDAGRGRGARPSGAAGVRERLEDPVERGLILSIY